LRVESHFTHECICACLEFLWDCSCHHVSTALCTANHFNTSACIFSIVQFYQSATSTKTTLFVLPWVVSVFFISKREVELSSWNGAFEDNRAIRWLLDLPSDHLSVFHPKVHSKVVELPLEIWEWHPERAIFSSLEVKSCSHSWVLVPELWIITPIPSPFSSSPRISDLHQLMAFNFFCS